MEVDYKGFCKALGAHIKQLRKAQGLSNRDILVIHGFNDSQWRQYERGSGLTVESLLKVAVTLGVTVGDLLNGLKDSPIAVKPTGKSAKGAKKASTKRAAREA